jgi:hypothetical protein
MPVYLYECARYDTLPFTRVPDPFLRMCILPFVLRRADIYEYICYVTEVHPIIY